MEVNTRLAGIKEASISGAKAGLLAGALAGAALHLVARRVPISFLKNGRLRDFDMGSHVLVGSVGLGTFGAVVAGRDFFSYTAEVLTKGPVVDKEIHAADKVVNGITSYRNIIIQNQSDIVARFDEAFERRQEAIKAYRTNQAKAPSKSF